MINQILDNFNGMINVFFYMSEGLDDKEILVKNTFFNSFSQKKIE